MKCQECGAEVVKPEKKYISVRVGSIARDGSCNFCYAPHMEAKVWVLNGNHLEVRLCPSCFRVLAKHALLDFLPIK